MAQPGSPRTRVSRRERTHGVRLRDRELKGAERRRLEATLEGGTDTFQASGRRGTAVRRSINGLKMSKKRRVASDRSWPPELKGPFPWQQLNDKAAKRFRDVEDIEQANALWDSYVKELRERETRQRVALLAKFFGRPWPQSEVDWLRLIFKVCTYFEVPGFRIRKKAGAPEKWGTLQNRQLFADVMSYVTKTGKSENAAIQHITKNPKKFLNRYDKVKESTTLHRQFLRAKKVFEESDHITGLLLLSRDR